MIVTVTFNPAVDQTVHLEGAPAPETVNRVEDAHFDAGGKGVNVSKFLTALDTETVASGLLGGFTGSFVSESLSSDGVATDFVDIDPPTRLNTTLLADAEYKFNQDGPQVDESVTDDVLEVVRSHDPDRVLVGGSLPPGIDVSAVDRIANGGEWATGVDVNGDLLGELTATYEFCKPNRPELRAATGEDVSTVAGCAEAAKAFRERGFGRVIASLGPDGALLAGPEGIVHAEALDVDAIDSVGAGDALLAGILAGVERGLDDEEALAAGTAVAATIVERTGTSIPDFDGLPDARSTVSTRWLTSVQS